MEPQPDWYRSEDADPIHDPAKEAYIEAVKIFGSEMTNDPNKVAMSEQASSIEEIQRCVQDAQFRYSAAHDSEVGALFSKFSSQVCLYGNIMDVFVQQHPEYVSLAWGAMKFVFKLVENHGAMIKSLATSLSKIADSLPQIKFMTNLYPTKTMIRAVAELYAHIMRFLLRAVAWYRESKFSHLLHSLTRPVELRHADVIQKIGACTETVKSLATAGAQSEQRDIHLELRKISRSQEHSDAVVLEIRQMMITHQSINSQALLDTNQRIFDLEVSHIMASISQPCGLDAAKALQYCAFVTKQHLRKTKSVHQPLWLSSKFRTWTSLLTSSLITIKGRYGRRFEVKEFCFKVINFLRSSNIHVVWILKTNDQEDVTRAPSVIDLLKELTKQVLRLNMTLHNERAFGLSCAKFTSAETEIEWLDILSSVLAGLPLVYVIIDVEAVSAAYTGPEHAFSWPSAADHVFRRLSERQIKTVVKVILVSYGSTISANSLPMDPQHVVLSVCRPRTGSAKGPGRTRFSHHVRSQRRVGVGGNLGGRAKALAL